MGSEAGFSIRGLGHRFLKDGPWVFQGIDLEVDAREFLGIVGPSGCGKTTLLRVIAGLLAPSAGEVSRGSDGSGRPWCSMVFQNLALFPWKTARENVSLGLGFRRPPRPGDEAVVGGLLSLMRLEGFASYYPRQLSGGMRQRVALARALIGDPEVLLMDEPFASLDAATRHLMQEELLRLWRERSGTVVFVTHSIEEALLLSDRVVLLSAAPGRVLADVRVPFARPRTLDVREDPEFGRLSRSLWDRLRSEVERPEPPPRGDRP